MINFPLRPITQKWQKIKVIKLSIRKTVIEDNPRQARIIILIERSLPLIGSSNKLEGN